MLSTNLSEIEVMALAVTLGLGEPLTPMQLLWINLISDIFPGLALAMEPPESDLMSRPPRDPREPILRRQDLMRTARESGVIAGGAMASYLYALWRYGPGPQASSQAFMTLSCAQLIPAFACRSEDSSIFGGRRRPSNTYLNLAIGGSLAIQALAAALPGLRKLMGIVPLGPLDLLVSGAGSMGPLLVNELLKISGREGRARATGPTGSKPRRPNEESGTRQ